MATLIKIDRNGSKHWEGMVTCDRCQGRGWYAVAVCNGQLVPSPVDNAVCYRCLGTGKVMGKWIERTPEYQAKLDAKREEKHRKREAEIREQQKQERKQNAQESLEKLGIPDGKVYLFLDADWETVKALGGRYDGSIGCYIGHPVDGMELLEVPVADVLTQDDWGRYHISASKSDMDKLKEAEMAKRHPSAWVGEIGQKINTTVTYHHSAWWEVESFYGHGTDIMYLHTFIDADGNQLVWKTQCGNQCEPGTKVVLKGTVKDLSEYRGQKQTVLTRCKVAIA